jgi:hypothetical protein
MFPMFRMIEELSGTWRGHVSSVEFRRHTRGAYSKIETITKPQLSSNLKTAFDMRLENWTDSRDAWNLVTAKSVLVSQQSDSLSTNLKPRQSNSSQSLIELYTG